MDNVVWAADANCKFSQILRHVREGQRYVVTRHGRPVARIVPVSSKERVRVEHTQCFSRAWKVNLR